MTKYRILASIFILLVVAAAVFIAANLETEPEEPATNDGIRLNN